MGKDGECEGEGEAELRMRVHSWFGGGGRGGGGGRRRRGDGAVDGDGCGSDGAQGISVGGGRMGATRKCEMGECAVAMRAKHSRTCNWAR